MALVATNDGDAGALHVVHSRRGASSAQRPPSSSASQRRQLTVDGGPLRMSAKRRKWSRPFVTRLQSTRHVDRISKDVCSRRQICSKLLEKRAFSVDVGIKSAARACRSARPAHTQRRQIQREAIPTSGVHTGASCRSMSSKRTETT